MVALLLDRGAAVDRASANGRTPLHLAAALGLGIAQKILARKPDVNAADIQRIHAVARRGGS